MFSGIFGTPTAAELQVDREIEECQSAFRAGRQISQIEPWNERLSRCSAAVQQMLDITEFLSADCGETNSEDTLLGLPEVSIEEQRELRILSYAEDAKIGQIRFIPANQII